MYHYLHQSTHWGFQSYNPQLGLIVEIFCTFLNVHEHTVSYNWIFSPRNGKRIDFSSGHSGMILSRSGALIVVSADLSDSGSNFSCVAENNAGRRVSPPATLTVFGKSHGTVGMICVYSRAHLDYMTPPCNIRHITIWSLFKNGLGPLKTKYPSNTSPPLLPSCNPGSWFCLTGS